MKLNWFSPLAPAQTDIAHYTERVMPALARLAEVTYWTDQRKWDPRLEQLAVVRSYRIDRMPWRELNRADATFYHIGNNPQFHGSIWQASRQLGGVIVLHDFRLHHFFDGIYRVKLRDLNSYLSIMAKYYGAEGRRAAALCYQSDARNIDEMAERYPLTELAVENAHAVLVHTTEAFESLANHCVCPLAYAPLPFSLDLKSRGTTAVGKGPIRLIVFGYIGRNRRLNSVLKALAGLAEKERFRLDVFGSILNDEKELRRQIAAMNLKHQVELHGFTSEAVLDEALTHCHLAINLRFPTMGEASGSQLRIWAHGLPSLVSRVGWYASLPEDSVAFVRTDENEVADIQKHLKGLLTDPDRFAVMGQRGRQELEDRHSPDAYAAAVIEIARQGKHFGSRAAHLKLADRAAAISNDWHTPNQRERAFERVAAKVYELGKRS